MCRHRDFCSDSEIPKGTHWEQIGSLELFAVPEKYIENVDVIIYIKMHELEFKFRENNNCFHTYFYSHRK